MADLDNVSNQAANPLTPSTGPVPPSQVQSSIPSWFSPSAWAKSVGGMADSVESWYSGSVLNPYHDLTAIGGAVEDAGQSVMAKVSSAAQATTASLSAGVAQTTSMLKWAAILAAILAAFYFLAPLRALLPSGRR
jgi:hypothetical protein